MIERIRLMNALCYLLTRIIKNSLCQLVKSPGKLVLALLILFGFGITAVSSFLAPPLLEQPRDVRELAAIALLLYSFIFLAGAMRGLSSGGTFYSMADVNLLFSTPVSRNKILAYGLIKQAGVSLLVGLLLIYQYPNIRNFYGLSPAGLIVLLLGYCVTIFCSQLTAMAIYSFTSADEKARTVLRTVIYVITAAELLYIGISAYAAAQGDSSRLLFSAVGAVHTLPVYLFPVSGWLTAAVYGCVTGAVVPAALGCAVTVLFSCGLIAAVILHNPDFYEDVLKATETSFSAITAKKEGKMAEALPKNIKLGKQGIGKGRGASAFYYKHLVEQRRSRIFLFDMNSLIFIVVTIALSVFMREAGIVTLFLTATYMQIFSTALGRWARELLLPYVYLVPESPFRKLLMISLENIRMILLEAVVIFIPVGLIMGLGPVDILFVIIGRFGYGILFMAGNFMVERLFGAVPGKALLMIIYFFVLFLIAVPGIVVGVMISMLFPENTGSIAILATAAWNLPVSLLITFLCRNILNYAELNNR